MKIWTVLMFVFLFSCSKLEKRSKEENDNLQPTEGIDQILEVHNEMDIRDWLPKSAGLESGIALKFSERNDTLLYYSIIDGYFNGEYKSSFEGGNPHIKGRFVRGVPVGVFKRYWKSSGIRDYVEFKDGFVNGLHIVKHESGKLHFYCHYIRGELDYMKAVDQSNRVYDSFITITAQGDLVSKKTFLKGEFVSFSAGLSHSGVNNPLFRYLILMDKTDTLKSIESSDIQHDFNIRFDKLGKHNIAVVIQEYVSEGMLFQGSTDIEFDISVIDE